MQKSSTDNKSDKEARSNLDIAAKLMVTPCMNESGELKKQSHRIDCFLIKEPKAGSRVQFYEYRNFRPAGRILK
jgi:hypothetical protein